MRYATHHVTQFPPIAKRDSRGHMTTTRRRIFISPKAKAESQYKHNQIQRLVSRRAHAHRAGRPLPMLKMIHQILFLKKKNSRPINILQEHVNEHTSMYQNIIMLIFSMRFT